MQKQTLTFLFPSSFTRLFYLVANVLPRNIWENKVLVLTRASLTETLIFSHLVYYQSIYPIFKENIKQVSCIKLPNLMVLYKQYFCVFSLGKDGRQLSWMSDGVMRFWFLLNFLFILAFFDILASLSISRVFSSGISGQSKSSCLDIPRVIIKFNMWRTFKWNYKCFNCQSSCLLLLLEVFQKSLVLAVASNEEMDFFWINSRETWLE